MCSCNLAMIAAAGQHQGAGVQPQTGQPGGQPAQNVGLFQSMTGWANPSLGEVRRADMNISLPGG